MNHRKKIDNKFLNKNLTIKLFFKKILKYVLIINSSVKAVLMGCRERVQQLSAFVAHLVEVQFLETMSGVL